MFSFHTRLSTLIYLFIFSIFSMYQRLFIVFLFFACISCMPEGNLPIRDTGQAPEYFIECYCQPGHFFTLTATSVLPVSENLEIDFSREMSVTIEAGREITLYHSIYTLPGSDFIYNYGSKERLASTGLDSIHLFITTREGKQISASSEVPPGISIYDYRFKDDEATIRFYTSSQPADNYYIFCVEAVSHDSIISKEIRYLDYSEHYSGGLTEKSVMLPATEKAQKIVFSLQRITRANYDYQISLNAANAANQSSIMTPVPLKGNLRGAPGIFTCYTEDRVELSDF